METKPDAIKIPASHREEIFASYAVLNVTVKGASIVGGIETLKKAREVNRLVEAPGLDLEARRSKTVTFHVDIWYRVSSL